ncbi:glycosyl hydrolase 108 family protein [Paraburkholderia unamae]|uniref:Glycosyl hydrolase family 108 n=1 Tax=Paraburkholderia unamae TaxID=219649 RepID=A0ABX5KR61_9BURK|nr:glycosyl hydrolase 108 family protein [Paraburkholderia unamae]PVX84353.1 glycosyl hydrolase family 108 [Paraburkholderia unamae]
MRVKIPSYEQQVMPALQASGAMTPVVAPQDNIGAGIEKVGQGLMQVADANQKLQDSQDLLAAQKAFTQNVGNFQENMKSWQSTAAPGAPNFTKDSLTVYDNSVAGALGQIQNTRVRALMDEQYNRYRLTMQNQAINFEAEQQQALGKNNALDALDAANKVVANDPTQYDSQLAGLNASVGASVLQPDVKMAIMRKAKDDLAYTAASSIAYSNPTSIAGPYGTGANPATGGGYSGGFSGADAFVAAKEGGLLPRDTNGTATNFGINQQANPDVDVKNLTPEQAAQVRKTRYWDAIHADALSPQMQPVAYNFAIQAGVGAANKLLQQSNGDPVKFRDLANGYYASIPPDKSQGYLDAWQARNNQAYQMGAAASTPADNPLLARLPWEQRVQVFNQAKTQLQQNMALSRAQLDTHLQDAQAMATQGTQDPNPLTMGDLLKAYGPLEAPARFRSYQDGQQLAIDVTNMKGMPATDIANIVNARAPLPGPGYADALHDHTILATAAQQVIQQRDADPAAYAAKNAPAVSSAGQVLSSNPTPQTAQAYAAATVAEQARLGIAKPQILSKVQAQNLEDQINANGGANADGVIQQQAQLWGPQWGSVFGQLKGISPIAKVVGYLGDSVPQATRQQLLANSSVKMDELKDGLASTDVSAAQTTLNGKMQPFAGTMAYTPGGPQTFSALYDATERLAYTYMRRGQSATDAANNAFNDVVGKQFNVSGSARIPAQYNASDVMNGAQGIINALPSMDLVTPPAPPNMKQEDVKQHYVGSLASSGKWITSADGKGLVLFDPVSQTVVRTKDGQPVGAPFTALSAKSSASNAKVTPPSPFNATESDVPGLSTTGVF